MPLTHRQALVLALFKYGLAITSEDVAEALKLSPKEARRVCEELERAGLLAE